MRERGGDFAILLDHFNRMYSEELNQDPLQFTDEAMEALSVYRWPGNVRELRNLVESLHLTLADTAVTIASLTASGLNLEGMTDAGDDQTVPDLEGEDQNLARMERSVITKAIQDNNGNLTLAAKQIGIARSTLYRKMAQFRIQRSFV